MKIGILGSGAVGQALGRGFAHLGYEVKIGSREPQSSKLRKWLKATGKKTSTGSFEESAKFGELVVVAILGTATRNAIKLAKPKNFANKVVIDVTNPLDLSKGGAPRLFVGFDNSRGEEIQRWLPTAKVVKTLNIIGSQSMVNPKFKEGEPDMFLCGDDKAAKKKVGKILHDFGWKNVCDLGGIEMARIMEPMCILWVAYALSHNNWNIAFKMLRK